MAGFEEKWNLLASAEPGSMSLNRVGFTLLRTVGAIYFHERWKQNSFEWWVQSWADLFLIFQHIMLPRFSPRDLKRRRTWKERQKPWGILNHYFTLVPEENAYGDTLSVQENQCPPRVSKLGLQYLRRLYCKKTHIHFFKVAFPNLFGQWRFTLHKSPIAIVCGL